MVRVEKRSVEKSGVETKMSVLFVFCTFFSEKN